MNLQAFRQPPGFARSERFVKRHGRMGIQVVHDQYDPLRRLVLFVQEVSQREGPIHASPPLRYPDMPVAAKRFDKHEDVARAEAFVFRVIPQRLAGTQRQRLPDFAHELFAGFIHANRGKSGIVEPVVDFENIFHPPDELAIVFLRKAPLLFQPRLNCIFFSVLRTVSGLMESTISNSTSLPASIRNVHRARPWGAGPQQVATSFASALPSSLRERDGQSCFFRRSAASNPSSTHRRRTLKTVLAATPRASATCASVRASPSLPWSALSRILARVMASADVFPLRTKASSSDRPVSVKRTMNTFFMATSLYCRGDKRSIRPAKYQNVAY